MRSYLSFIFFLSLATVGLYANGQEVFNINSTKQAQCASAHGVVLVEKSGVYYPEKPNKEYQDCLLGASSNSCESDYQAYVKAISGKNPCASFGITDVESCQALVNKCSGGVGSAGTGEQSLEEILQEISGVAGGLINGEQAQSTYNLDKKCSQLYGDKADRMRKEAREAIEKKKKEIEDARKEMNEDNKELARETAKIKEDQAKLEAEIKKNIQQLDVDKREKLSALAQDISKSATEIRKLSTQVIKKKQEGEKVQFDYLNAMKQYTEKKVTTACKNAVNTAKSCYKRAKRGERFGKDDACNGFTFSSSKGAKGTAALNKQIKQIKESCIEGFETQISEMKYSNSDKLRTIDMDIKEIQAQISDANEALEQKKKDTESFSKEMDQAKTLEEENLTKQIANFTDQLQNLEKNIKEKLAQSEARIQQLNKELTSLTSVSFVNDNVNFMDEYSYRSIIGEASGALNEIDHARKAAAGSCCPGGQAISSKYTSTCLSTPGVLNKTNSNKKPGKTETGSKK